MGPAWSFQLHKLEYCPTKPNDLYGDNISLFLKDAKVQSVPGLHLFGRTADGSSVCARIRNAYPYFYVELPQTDEEFICGIGAGIDFALTGSNQPGRTTVHRLDLLQARVMYHYEQEPRPFLKVSLYSPFQVKKTAEAFQTGRIHGRPMRCYEAHIPFVLQFMMDHGLFGMDQVHLQDPNIIAEDDERTSGCDYELECSSFSILNRGSLSRFGKLREGAAGGFPDAHVMPSVVSMLESLNLSTTSHATQDRLDQLVRSMDQSHRFQEQLNRLFVKDRIEVDTSIFRLPKAHSYEMSGETTHSGWENFSFGFSSQQVHRASMAFKSDLTAEVLVDNDDHQDFAEVEGILGEMLAGRSDDTNDNQGIPQVDGAWDINDVNDNWSHASHATDDSILGQLSFSHAGDHEYDYKHVGIPPRTRELLESLRQAKLPRKIHTQPFESVIDSTTQPGSGVRISPAFNNPITYSQALDWLKEEHTANCLPPPQKKKFMSQIEGPTQKFSLGFDPNLPVSSQLSASEALSIFAMECFGDSKGDLLPNPENDSIVLVAWSFYSSIKGQEIRLDGSIIVLGEQRKSSEADRVKHVQSEREMFEALVQTVNGLDPDILCGYEVEGRSWGLLQERAHAHGIFLSRAISRSHKKRQLDPSKAESEDPYAAKRTSTFQVFGRITLNVWRVMRSELALRSYSFEHVAMHILKHNFPRFRQNYLKLLYHGSDCVLPRPDLLIKYHNVRARGTIDLLIQTEVINRICEFARLYGIDFFSVVSRGSQYKVESLMLRLAHLENFLAYSPSKQDLVRMAAPEALPLVMEPQSAFYVDPVVVLDFQSLYPSIIIAYNYCYTTCLGRVDDQPYPKRFGANFIQDGPCAVGCDQITVSPNRVAFVKKGVREGVLPKMLTELLEARITVKTELAGESDPMRRKVLDARQLGLKLISNVIYGYTSASFSGRMPCIEIADSVVQTGRSTLEQAVKWIHEKAEWQAHVVYGDTDSLFVRLPGRTLDEAHKLGRDIAAYVTDRCPAPVKLKFEKVYLPSLLMSKKRYVGFKYEKAGQEEPVFDAKGIETVRRDNCPLVPKILEKTIKLLARTKDITAIKAYVQRQFQKILAGAKDNLADFVFSKEVRLGTYAADRRGPEDVDEEDDGAAFDVEGGQRPHSAIIALQRIQQDPRDVAQYGERVPFVIVYGQGNDRLRELVASLDELIINPKLRLNAVYYIVKCLIPALNRVMGLVGIDVHDWYSALPRPTSRPINAAAFIRLGKTRAENTIDSFFKSSACMVCAGGGRDAFDLTRNGGAIRICRACHHDLVRTVFTLTMRLNDVEHTLQAFHILHANHTGPSQGPIADLTGASSHLYMCWSYDCPLFWKAVSLRQHEVPLRQQLLSALKALSIPSLPDHDVRIRID